MHKRTFIKEYFRNLKSVGALSQSSRFLIKKVLKHIDFSKADLIVELGAGPGKVTKALLKNMKPSSKLISFELNDTFISTLKNIEDKRLTIIHDSAENISQYLNQKADYIVSELPLSSLPGPAVSSVMTSVKEALKEEGSFIQPQYRYRKKFYKNHFPKVKLDFTLFNIPPSFIYLCSR